MQFYVMMQTSFHANLVRVEHSVIGVVRALALIVHDKIFMLLAFQFLAYVESSSLCASNDISNFKDSFIQS